MGKVVYEFELPSELVFVHLVFYISMLKKRIGDSSLVDLVEHVGDKENFSYKEVQVYILDHQVCKLRTQEVASVKVLWRIQTIEEATCKAEEDMKAKYPYFFTPSYESI